MSESLKEKAKTLPEWHVEVRKKGETDCGCCSSIGTKDACCDCAVILSWHPKFIEVSVAQQEIDKLKTFRDNAYKKWCESEDKIKVLLEERGLLKQKLQTFYDTLVVIAPKTVKIEEYDKKTKELWIVQTADPSEWTMFIDSLGEWLVKFKELLK